MRYIYFLLIVSLTLACSSPINQEKINYEEETILIGEVDWDGLTKDPYNEWFRTYYFDYQVDTASLNQIADIDDLEIILFLGTWCSDSQLQVPQFYKILDYLGYDISKMKVYALEQLEEGGLVSPAGIEKEFEIGFVPTMIFKRNGVELGRITEYPEITIEKDMVKIMR